MGKKTDKMLKAVSDRSDACTQTSNLLLQLVEVWGGVQKDWDKYEPEMLKLKNWEDHPYAKKRIAIWEKGKGLAARLKGEIHQLNMALSEFRQFLQKKEKSKNPFKSKNSLPGAKAMVKSYDTVLKDYTDIMLLSQRQFH